MQRFVAEEFPFESCQSNINSCIFLHLSIKPLLIVRKPDFYFDHHSLNGKLSSISLTEEVTPTTMENKVSVLRSLRELIKELRSHNNTVKMKSWCSTDLT